MAEERFTGVVQWFNNIKGFGFIKPDDGGEDLFVHQSSIRSDGYRTLLEGDRVEFCIATGDNDKTKAVDVTGLHGAPLQPRAAAGNRGPAGYGFGARRNGSGAACYQCATAKGGSGGGAGGGGGCFRCGEVGHLARDCGVEGGRFGGGGGGGNGGRGGGGGNSTCFNCGKPGHFARECVEASG
ncbi:cold shock protein 2 [Cajanus cajan]|uniref:cold shock protein 2 n=1 Tax=Cajanus cajan TaxID=3821 RepID=UPI00098D762D|nr:cold shock protein 2 [Cajanus cajan]